MVERSGREVAIERLLRNMEEVWLSKQFHFKPHTRFVMQVSTGLLRKQDAHTLYVVKAELLHIHLTVILYM